MIFNSLGSNYRAETVKGFGRSLFEQGAAGALELYLSERYNARALLTHKGRQALRAGLDSLHLEPGSEVAVNGYTCFAVYEAVAEAGLTPIYIDIPGDALNFSAEQLAKTLKHHPQIKAVIVQNTLGMAADIGGIERICEEQKIHLVEDLAHSIGLIYPDGRETGTVGHVSILSFSQDKVVDGVSGGALLLPTSNEAVFEYVSVPLMTKLREFLYLPLAFIIRSTYSMGIGKAVHKLSSMLGLLAKPMDGDSRVLQNMRDWQASLVLTRFKQLSVELQHRQHVAAVYTKMLPEPLQFKAAANDIFLRFPIKVSDPKGLVDFLGLRGIYVSDTWYDAPVSPKKLLARTNYEPGECKHAEEVSMHIVNLPTHVNVTEEQAKKITEGVQAWLSQTV